MASKRQISITIDSLVLERVDLMAADTGTSRSELLESFARSMLNNMGGESVYSPGSDVEPSMRNLTQYVGSSAFMESFMAYMHDEHIREQEAGEAWVNQSKKSKPSKKHLKGKG